MKKLVLAAAIATAFTGSIANAQDKKPDHEVSFNAAVVSDYRYRGISQTRLKPALQGGVDYVNNPTGLYVGAWASTIKWIKDANGKSDVELDVYGGKRGELGSMTYDVGVLTYYYSRNKLNPSANTTEIYGQLGFGPAYVKYSHAVTNLFGFANSKRSGYVDVGANFDLPVGGLQLNLHAGHQKVKNNGAFSYTDWKVGVTKDFGVVTGALAVIGTDVDTYVGPNGKNLGKNALWLSVSKVF